MNEEQLSAYMGAAQADIHAALNGPRGEMAEHLTDAIENLNRAYDLLLEED